MERQPEEKPAASGRDIVAVYEHRFAFPESARDQNLHVNNVEYVRALQEAAIAHTHRNGWPVEELQERGWSWVVRSHRIEYFQGCLPGEPVTLYTWVVNFHRIRSLRRYRFIRDADRCVLADAETDWVFISTAKKRPVAIPQEVMDAYIPVPDADPR